MGRKLRRLRNHRRLKNKSRSPPTMMTWRKRRRSLRRKKKRSLKKKQKTKRSQRRKTRTTKRRTMMRMTMTMMMTTNNLGKNRRLGKVVILKVAKERKEAKAGKKARVIKRGRAKGRRVTKKVKDLEQCGHYCFFFFIEVHWRLDQGIRVA